MCKYNTLFLLVHGIVNRTAEREGGLMSEPQIALIVVLLLPQGQYRVLQAYRQGKNICSHNEISRQYIVLYRKLSNVEFIIRSFGYL